MRKMVVTAGAIRRAKLQSWHNISILIHDLLGTCFLCTVSKHDDRIIMYRSSQAVFGTFETRTEKISSELEEDLDHKQIVIGFYTIFDCIAQEISTVLFLR